MTEIKNIEDAKKRNLEIFENKNPIGELLREFDEIEGLSPDAVPPSCAQKAPGDVCFVGNCINGRRLILFCDESKGCGGQYTYEDC